MKSLAFILALVLAPSAHADGPPATLFLQGLADGALGDVAQITAQVEVIMIDDLDGMGFLFEMTAGQRAYTLALAAPFGQNLRVRSYEKAREWPWGNPVHPRFSLSAGRCDQASARFEVKELELDPERTPQGEQRPTRLAADFIQTCAGVPRVAGAIRFNSKIPVQLPIEIAPAPAQPLDPVDRLIDMHSAQGDYIGQGKNWRLRTGDGLFLVQREGGGIVVTFEGDTQWEFVFTPKPGQELREGLYSRATRYPFSDQKGAPGLEVTGEGRGCNTLKGSFEVKELVWKDPDAIDRLAIDFTQYCEETMPPLRGSLRINSSVPTP